MKTSTDQKAASAWLAQLRDRTLIDATRALGELTALKGASEGFRAANLERALVLDRLVQTRRPARILELGTGRGLGCIAMAAAAAREGVNCQIVTVDLYGPDEPQDWPMRINEELVEGKRSRTEVWSNHIPEALTDSIEQVTGKTTDVLRRFIEEGRQFDLVFIDAGHDLHSVMSDLVFSFQLLAPDGAILMDDFSPLDDFGIGTCVAVAQAAKAFGSVETFITEGVVYGDAKRSRAPRGMALLSEPRPGTKIRAGTLRRYRIAASFLHRSYSQPWSPFEVTP